MTESTNRPDINNPKSTRLADFNLMLPDELKQRQKRHDQFRAPAAGLNKSLNSINFCPCNWRKMRLICLAPKVPFACDLVATICLASEPSASAMHCADPPC